MYDVQTRQMIMKNPQRRPSVIDIVRTEFVILHISRLLSHTIRMGKGGAEGAVGGIPQGQGGAAVDPEEVDRNIEKERERQRRESAEQEKNDKEVQVRFPVTCV
jgi:hypothetical protein